MRRLKSSPCDHARMWPLSTVDDLLRRAGRRHQRIPAVHPALTPLSRSVDTFGCIGERLLPLPAIARIDARRRSAISARHRTPRRSGCRRASSDVSTSAEVRCGTMVIGMPVAKRISSAVTFCVLPGLMVPMLNAPGLARAIVSTSLSRSQRRIGLAPAAAGRTAPPSRSE